MIRGFLRIAACALALLVVGGPAFAVDQVPVQAPGGSKVTVDVWINKEEGGVYQPGENMRVFFRTNADAFVIVYNIDTDGYIHLVYPYGPSDQMRVEGGRTYVIPARHDPYELVADGPTGMEFVVAVASRAPFRDLPWYLTSGAPEGDAEHAGTDNPTDSGVIAGDPYVGMEQLNQRIVPPGSDADADVGDIYFYIEKRVEYPRYVCADCHYSSFAFDPYLSVCPVVDVRIDATWVRYAPVHVGVARPRYYYWVRPVAPDRYRAWKERWSSIDGSTALRSRFVVAPNPAKATPRELKARRAQPEFQDLRRTRPGRLWQGRDEVLRLWEQEHQKNATDRSRSSGEVRSSKDRPKAERPAPDRERPPDANKGGDQSGTRDRGKSGDSGGKDQGKSRDQSQNRGREQEKSRPQSPPPKNDVERRDR
ncbi:MAG: DUF4384 domain-containing protein [Candidatus Eiseniibacteriota bacterium]